MRFNYITSDALCTYSDYHGYYSFGSKYRESGLNRYCEGYTAGEILLVLRDLCCIGVPSATHLPCHWIF